MELPAFAPMTDAALLAVARRHGASEVAPLPATGIFNALYAVGQHLILRVPRDHPAFLAALAKEPLAVPFARSAGVRTPELIEYDDSRTLLPVPYTVYERVRGETFGLLPGDPVDSPQVWREIGVDLARLHRSADPASTVAGLLCEDLPDSGQLADELAARGSIGTAEVRWLRRWLDRLDALSGEPARIFVHGDIQSTNVMLVEGSYGALLDWGACGWAEPAADFAGIPLRAVPAMLAGYLSAGGTVDDPLRAAIVRRHLQIGLFLAHRSPEPDLSWAERPLGVLVDVLRFFVTAPTEWRPAGPPR